MVTVALLVRLEAKPGKEAAVADFLRGALPLVQMESATNPWFAVQMGPSSFGIFDAFPDDAGRQTHLSGPIGAALKEKAVQTMTNTEVTAIEGAQTLERITLTNLRTGESRAFNTRWLFICFGGAPRTTWAAEVGIIRDAAGYLVTGPDLSNGNGRPSNWQLDRSPYYLETNVPGLFAAGDVRHGSVKRCASAVGEGAMAVAFVHRYLANG